MSNKSLPVACISQQRLEQDFPINRAPLAHNLAHYPLWALKSAAGVTDYEATCGILYAGFSEKFLKDPEKYMPNAARIEAIIAEKRSPCFAPRGLDLAQWKHYVNKFEYLQRANREGPASGKGLVQVPGQLYWEPSSKCLAKVESLYKAKKTPRESWFQPPVTSVDDLHIILVEAHVAVKRDGSVAHLGRDATWDAVQLMSSTVTKAITAEFVKRCPTCSSRVTSCRKAAKLAEPKREATRARKKASQLPVAANQNVVPPLPVTISQVVTALSHGVVTRDVIAGPFNPAKRQYNDIDDCEEGASKKARVEEEDLVDGWMPGSLLQWEQPLDYVPTPGSPGTIDQSELKQLEQLELTPPLSPEYLNPDWECEFGYGHPFSAIHGGSVEELQQSYQVNTTWNR